MKTFCTIITANYFPKALALFKSIRRFDKDIGLEILVVDNDAIKANIEAPTAIRLTYINELKDYGLVEQLYRKYAHMDPNYFRWSLKPVFISYLLQKGYDKVLYTDCDMYFFNNYEFLFRELDQSSILLTPHWRNSNPAEDKESFISLFTSGIFSAGFIGVNKSALPAMRWWTEACHFMMGPKFELGIYDDQKYLDVFPVIFEKTMIIRHRGCNVGPNLEQMPRILVNREVMICGQYPVIFVHFDGLLVEGILKGYDQHLLPHLNQYKTVFEESGTPLSEFLKEVNIYADAGILQNLKWRLRIRTRIKRALYKLSQAL